MLKILEDKMKHENDKWLEEQLKITPHIEENDFCASVMGNIEEYRLKECKERRIILLVAYISSCLLFLLVTPWSWLTQIITQSQQLLSDVLSVSPQIGNSTVIICILFFITISAFVLGQDDSR